MPDPDPAVSVIFARAASALAASGHRVTVTTADLATPLSPWSLAWARWDGEPWLMVRRHVDGDETADPWDDVEWAGLLATLAQLPELVSRVAAAAERAARNAGPEEVERLGRDVAGAIGVLLPPGPEREGGRP